MTKHSKDRSFQPARTSIKFRLTLLFAVVISILVILILSFMLIVDGGTVIDDAEALLVSEVQKT